MRTKISGGGNKMLKGTQGKQQKRASGCQPNSIKQERGLQFKASAENGNEDKNY